jgi:hypothetical protein
LFGKQIKEIFYGEYLFRSHFFYQIDVGLGWYPFILGRLVQEHDWVKTRELLNGHKRHSLEYEGENIDKDLVIGTKPNKFVATKTSQLYDKFQMTTFTGLEDNRFPMDTLYLLHNSIIDGIRDTVSMMRTTPWTELALRDLPNEKILEFFTSLPEFIPFLKSIMLRNSAQVASDVTLERLKKCGVVFVSELDEPGHADAAKIGVYFKLTVHEYKEVDVDEKDGQRGQNGSCLSYIGVSIAGCMDHLKKTVTSGKKGVRSRVASYKSGTSYHQQVMDPDDFTQ